jgi:hypothetical protein
MEDFFIFNVHLKCCGDGILNLANSTDEENRRFNSLNMIKNYIDQYHSSDNTVILGDYNDLLTDANTDNIFSQFITDSANYSLADFHIANGNSSDWSYPSWPSHLDHIIVSNELTDNFNNNNVQTIRIDNYLNGGFFSYDAIISDHLPVGISFSFINSISGCIDSTAINFNASANIDDSSCVYSLLPCSDLFISEYICGTSYYSHDKAIEIYNPTNSVVNLNDYRLERYRNGETNSLLGGVTQLSGSLFPGDVWIVTNGDTVDIGYGIISSTLYNLRDQAAPDGSYPTPLHMNGDDVIILSKISSGQILDVVGKIGEDPGVGWTADSTTNFTDANGAIVWTRNHTLVRKSNILSPDNYGNDLFNPSLQWDSLSIGTFNNLGTHNCDCPIYGCTDPLAINYDALATVDDGTCSYLVDCFAPSITGLSVSDIIHDRVTLNFDNMNSYDANGTQICRVDQIRIKYREVGTSSWSQKNIASPTGLDPVTFICNSTQNSSKLVLGLLPATTYEWQVKLWYCNGSNTGWSLGPDFTTLGSCPNIGNLVVTTPTTTKATFTWDGSNGAYSFVRLKARPESANPQPSDWFSIGGAGVSYPIFTKNKNGLTPGQNYRGQARVWCDPNGGPYRSSWTPLIYWIQPTSVRLEGGESIVNLDVYPNPSRDAFNITFTSETVQDLRVRVFNILGDEIACKDLKQFVGEYTKQIDITTHAKGIYFLKIQTSNSLINKKLILR